MWYLGHKINAWKWPFDIANFSWFQAEDIVIEKPNTNRILIKSIDDTYIGSVSLTFYTQLESL